MSTVTAEFNTEKLGQWSDETRFPVDRDRILAYAEATNDPIAQHAEGTYAPPVFNVVPPFESLMPLTTEVVPAEHLMRVVHGMQDFRFHRPIEPGQTLVVRGAPIGVHPRSTGTSVIIKAETRTEDGELVCEQFMTAYFRGVVGEQSVGEEAADHKFPENARESDPVGVVQQTFDEDQTFRYGPAAGDPMPIHLDEDFAKAMGFPGIIIHGLCTMAFASRAVIETCCPEDPTRLTRLAVRFSKPAFPRQTITTRIWAHPPAHPPGSGPGTHVFETTADNGDVVIKDGLAEIRS
jgi:acyl dehydratase